MFGIPFRILKLWEQDLQIISPSVTWIWFEKKGSKIGIKENKKENFHQAKQREEVIPKQKGEKKMEKAIKIKRDGTCPPPPITTHL